MRPASDAYAKVHLKDYLKIVWKHRWLITGIFLVTLVSGAVWTFRQVPIFRASAMVLIDPEAPKVLNIQEVTPMGAGVPAYDENYYKTQYEIIKSRPVLERAIQTLNLKGRMPEVAAAGEPYPALLGSVSVEAKRETRLVFVRVEHPNPALAAEVANAIANGYVKYNLDLKLKGARDALAWLAEEAASLKAKVQESSMAVQNYRVKAGILGLQEQRQITAQKIMDFNKAYLEAQAQRLSVEAKLRELTQIAKDPAGAQTIFTVADNALIQKLKAESSELGVQRSKLLEVYKEKHPEILKIEAQIQQVNRKLDVEIQTMLRAIQTEYAVAKAREATLLNNVNQLRREGQELSEKEIQYLTLTREADSTQQLYEAVLKRLKETGVTGGLETNNVRVLEEATPPASPVRPKKSTDLALSVALGLFLGIGVALAIEYFDTTIRSPDEVERVLGLPVIAIVPAFTVKR